MIFFAALGCAAQFVFNHAIQGKIAVLDPNSPCLPRTGTVISEPMMSAIQDIASYARSRQLEGADELLTEFMAIFSQRVEPLPLHMRISSEGRALNVLRFLCEQGARHDDAGGTMAQAS